MNEHITGAREQWLAARLELLAAEKELTRRSDALARRRRELPWVRIDKAYRFDTDEGTASLADLFRGRSQLLVNHFMFGPAYAAGCPSCSAIADGFDRSVVHLGHHDVTLCAVSRAPFAKLQAYKRRMGWSFPWASSFGGDFNADFNASLTEAQQREARVDYNYRREEPWDMCGATGPVAEMAASTGTDVATYTRERPALRAKSISGPSFAANGASSSVRMPSIAAGGILRQCASVTNALASSTCRSDGACRISVPARARMRDTVAARDRFRSAFAGTSRATGSPCRVSTTSSPDCTRSMSSDSLARAS